MYNFSTYDSRQKFGHDHLGKQSYGKNRIVHQYETDDDLKEDDEELDSFVNDMHDKVKAKTGISGKIVVSDFLRGRQDNAGPSKNQPLGLMEFSGHHKNTVRKGISPYKQSKHSAGPIGTGGAGQAFKTTGNFKRTGTLYGFSRPHKNLSTIEDNIIFNLSDIMHPFEKSFLRQQNNVRKILKLTENLSR